jgi:hypothetical protein
VNDKERLKLIVLYDANQNEYSISAHNLEVEPAQQMVDRWNPQLIEGCSLIVLDQVNRHSVADARSCRTCRRIVERSANLDPKPKFTGKKKEE